MSYGFGTSDWEHASQDVAFQRDLALRDAPQWVLDSIREQSSEEREEAPPKRRRRYY